MENNRKFLIIGSGLSGLSVAAHLIKRGKDVTVVDSGENFSSIVAAGMINPLVFKRMTKSWRVDDFTPYLQSFYGEMEQETQSNFFHQIQIRRMFSSEHERDLWMKKQEREDFQNYMNRATEEDANYDRALNEFGSGRIKNGAFVDTTVFLDAMKNWVEKKGKLITKKLDYSELNGTILDGIHYDEVIFCEGYSSKDNPWFGYLPLNQTKGETITIKSDSIPEDESVNRKCFILPLGDKTFKVGATYEWHTSTLNTTEEGKKQLLEKVSYLTDQPFEVIDQGAGVRPTVIDRRPLIGTHPKHNNYHIFNGLGTKGYMLAPLMSKEFVDFLLDGKALHEEVNISRFEDQL